MKQHFLQFPKLTESQRISICSPNNFGKGIVGNKDAVARLARIAFDMLEWENHCCDNSGNVRNHPCRNIALIGLPGTGKTTFARLLASTTGLPFLEVQGQSLPDTNTLLVQIAELLENIPTTDNHTLELQETAFESRKFVIPPMIVFIDECHTLKDRVVQSLLKATEAKDRTLVTEKNWTADCQHITWIIATTKRGLLDQAFDRRFSQITLNPYTRKEIAQIIHLNNPQWELDYCNTIAGFSKSNAGRALMFAEDVKRALRMYEIANPPDPNLSHKEQWIKTWFDKEKLVREVARQHGIDQYGMPFQVLEILKALADGPVSKARMCGIANVEQPELENFIMPPLLTTNPDGEPPLVAIEPRGYVLTKAGQKELEKRGISYTKIVDVA